jgi:lysozyme
MRTSRQGMVEIAAHEGIVSMPYRDSVGIWTIGVGHTASAGAPDPQDLPRAYAQPMSQIMEIFSRDLARFEARVNRFVKVDLAQHEFDALVSFDFNTGGIDRARLTRLLNEGNRDGAADAFMGWTKPKEIIGRRKMEQKLFRTGHYHADGRATAYEADAAGRVLWRTGRDVNVLAMLGEDRPAPPHSGPVAHETPVLRQGDRGDAVRALQAALARHGLHLKPDGAFGPKTHLAVKLFQMGHGLKKDGIAGKQTWAALLEK